MSVMDELVDTLTLEPIEVNLFRRVSPPEERQRIFGGPGASGPLCKPHRSANDRLSRIRRRHSPSGSNLLGFGAGGIDPTDRTHSPGD